MKRKTFQLIFILVIISSLIYVLAFLKYRNKSFILVYHRVHKYEGGLKSLYVSPKYFDFQMKYLKFRKYKSVTLDELREMIINKKIQPKVFCITFDDGYRDTYEFAYPILKKYGFNATVFVTTDAIGKKFSYPRMPEAQHMTVEELNKIKDVFYIGAHSVSHKDMEHISSEEVKFELIQSKRILEEKLNIKVEHFCYPFGKKFDNYQNLLFSSGYLTACSTKTGLIDKNSDLYDLSRIEWKELSSMSIKDFLKNFEFYIKILCGV